MTARFDWEGIEQFVKNKTPTNVSLPHALLDLHERVKALDVLLTKTVLNLHESNKALHERVKALEAVNGLEPLPEIKTTTEDGLWHCGWCDEKFPDAKSRAIHTLKDHDDELTPFLRGRFTDQVDDNGTGRAG